jgi:putative spermidine/putrescine transport system permease protein
VAAPGLARRDRPWLIALMLPVLVIFAAFFILPMARLAGVGAGGPRGLATYAAIVTEPRYFRSLLSTLALSAGVTVLTLAIATLAGVFLQRNTFRGRSALIAMLTFPLAFPGVVVGFMVIMLAGRQGLIGDISRLLMGYLYFSIPRVILTIMAAAEKLDRNLEEAARSMGASAWQVVRDVILPGLRPAFLSAGAICFATSMGAFGTAFTLATEIEVLPMTIYTEFTLRANIALAAALSLVLGVITWLALALARTAAGSSVAASA